jgi:hypothetical protein
MHTMTTAACSECGDLDGCHLRSRLARFREAHQTMRDEFKKYGVTVPKVVCLCGSTRFLDAFRKAEYDATLAGQIILTIGCDSKSDAELFKGPDATEIKARLDDLHKRKIDLADEILVLNVGGYIGDSTRSEIDYARRTGKPVRWLETPA